ncbi:MAG: succinate CoA transferase [Myxococcales bacterium]|nr:MAG: succinate CoA transferase [Myxococcales bacterium]
MNRDRFTRLSAQDAAAVVKDGNTVGFSGFTAAGSPKAVPRAIADFAKAEHAANKNFKIRVIAGASTGASLDEALAQAEAISWRTPFQASPTLRKQINNQQVEFIDMHLSHVPQSIEFGFIGKIDVAVIEATDITADGRVYLSASGGISPSLLRHADKIIIELNEYHSKRLCEMHDVAILPTPPHREAIHIFHPMERIGTPFAWVDPKKIVGIVETNEADGISEFSESNEACLKIAQHVVRFLVDETKAGRVPESLLPLQGGVGNISNAVFGGIGQCDDIQPFHMYTEVFQDTLLDLMESGRMLGASTCSLTLSDDKLRKMYDNMDYFAPRLVIRPQELSNNPGVIRRLGVISINAVLEVDMYGCANSTHVCGTHMMNGVGGSGDFVRNAYLSILVTPSVAKGGKISAIVPMVSHVDHNEHSLQIVVTEQGLADLRGLGPIERAKCIINNCAHPDYRDYLFRYMENSRMGHLRHDLGKVFELHENLLRNGQMLP